MKKVLVTGASGAIGEYVIKYLLSEGRYDITALDLENKKTYTTLKRFKKRIKIIYNDVLNSNLIEQLVKENDYIIHLASCMPENAELHPKLANLIEKDGTESIVKAINYYNPECFFIYASTTSLYSENPACVSSKIKASEFSNFDTAKYSSEKIIRQKLKNYVIVRLPLVLSDLNKDNFIYNVKPDDFIETISKEDAAYAFVRCISKKDKLRGRVINIGGGETCQIRYKDLLTKIYKYHGISRQLIFNKLFVEKNYKSPILKDSKESNDLLKYRNDSIDSYFMRQKRRSKKRNISKLFGSFLNKIYNKGGKNKWLD